MTDIGTDLARGPGGRSASVVGADVAVPFSTGRSTLVPLRRTRLEIRIRRRAEAAAVRDGTAVTVRDAAAWNGTEQMVAADLSQALLQPCPVQPKAEIGVP